LTNIVIFFRFYNTKGGFFSFWEPQTFALGMGMIGLFTWVRSTKAACPQLDWGNTESWTARPNRETPKNKNPI